MTEKEFRHDYCELLQYYQFIELHLRGICAAFEEDKSWFEALDNYECDTLGKLLFLIKNVQSQKKLNLFSPDDLNALDSIRNERNFWVHQCFVSPGHVIFKHGNVRGKGFPKRIKEALNTAIEWDIKVTEAERMVVPKPI